jgi:hypothetical protein
MFTTASISPALHQQWKLKLGEWAADGSLGAAAQEAFRLEGKPEALAVLAALISRWAAGDFSALPPIVLLPASSMPGAAGAYAISTGNIYLNRDWLAGASAAQAMAVLMEELGHHLDWILNVRDTPGDEGELFACLVRGVKLSRTQLHRMRTENDSIIVKIGGEILEAEQAVYNLGLRQGNNDQYDKIDSLDPGDIWHFSISGVGTSNHYIQVSSAFTNVDLVLDLYNNSTNQLLRRANAYDFRYNQETISLENLLPGSYRAVVYNVYGANIPSPGYADYRLSINSPQSLPDLVAYKPSDWSDSLVISTLPGTSIDASTITTNDTIYIDASWINQGTSSTGSSFTSRLLLNGQQKAVKTSTLLNSNTFTFFSDLEIAPLAAGIYRLALEIDSPSNLITESNETNNGFYKDFTVVAPNISRDAYESNDSMNSATNLGTINGKTTRANLTINSATDTDYFSFKTTGLSGPEDYVAAYFDWTKGVIDLNLIDSTGKLLYYALGSYGWNYIPLGGLPAATYYIQAGSYRFQTSPSYVLEFNTPNNVIADRFEANNSFLTAKDLGPMSGFQRIENLSIHLTANQATPDQDIFKFQFSGRTTEANSIRIDFDNSRGNLGLGLYNSQGQLIEFSNTYGNIEEISLAGLASGSYFIQVYGSSGAVNDYDLTINAPGASSSIAPDTLEGNGGNNTQQTATTLKQFGWLSQVGFNSWKNLSIGSNDQDWFRFDLQKQGTAADYVGIEFETYQGDLDLELYNSSGLIKSAKGFRDRELVSLENLAAGTYFARVIGLPVQTNPDYSLFIKTPGSDRFEENDTKEDAKALNRTSALQTWDSLSIDDQDWFKISLPSGLSGNEYVSVNFDHSQGDIDLELYTNIGTTTLRESTGVGNSESISLAGLAGEYYIRVIGYGSATNPNYSLTLNAPISNQGDWLESNNSRQTATDLNIQFNEQLQAGKTFVLMGADSERPLSINDAIDQDWFKFSIASAGQLGDYATISFNHTAGDLDLYLYDSATASTPIRKSEGISNIQTIDLKGLAAGNYYLQVSGYKGATNSAYSLSIEAPFLEKTGDWSEANNSSSNARDLGTIAKNYRKGNLSIHNSSDVDWFKFSLAGKGGLNDRIGIDFDHGKGDLDIELYGNDGVSLLNSSKGVSSREEISLNTLAAGSYLLKILGYNGAVNPEYTLFIDAPENIAGDWAEQGSTNNSIATARDLRNVEGFQSWDPLSIHNAGDQDWFKFTTLNAADSNSYINISFDQALGDLELALYDVTGTVALGRSETIENYEQLKLKNADGTYLPAGTYLIQVKGYKDAVTNPEYQLSINAPSESVLDLAEPNNSRSTAKDLREVQGQQVLHGLSIHQSGDNDWFKFNTVATGLANHFLAIEFDNAQGDLQLEVLDQNGNLLTNRISASASNSNRELVSLKGLSAGSYYARVYGAKDTVINPNYDLIINAPQIAKADWIDRGPSPNNTLATAYDLRHIDDSISLGSLSIDSTADQDWFKLVVNRKTTGNQYARIDFNHDEGNLQLELFDSLGTTRLAGSRTSINSQQLSLAGRDAGVYFLRVSGAANPIYSLSVKGISVLAPDRLEDSNKPYQLRDLAFGGFRTQIPLQQFPSHLNYKGNLYGVWDPNWGQRMLEEIKNGTTTHQNEAAYLSGYGQRVWSQAQTNLSNVNSVFSPAGAANYFKSSGEGYAWLEKQEQDRLNQQNNRILQALKTPNSSKINMADLKAAHSYGIDVRALVPREYTSYKPHTWQTLPSYSMELPQSSRDMISPLLIERKSSPQINFPWRQQLVNGSWGSANNLSQNQKIYIHPSLLQGYSGSAGTAFAFSPQPNLLIEKLSIDSNADQDWFQFSLPVAGKAGQFIGINFDNDLGDLQLELFERFNTTTNTSEAQYKTYLVDRSNGSGDSEQITLAGLAQGDYLVRVTGVNGATNPNYLFTYNAPPQLDAAGDWIDQGTTPNNSSSSAYNLKTIEGFTSLSGLSLHSSTDTDWFQFSLKDSISSEGYYARIDFDHSLGDLDFELFDTTGSSSRRSSTTIKDFEEISLNGITADTYQLRVSGYNKATNPNYTLSIYTPATIQPDTLEPNGDNNRNSLTQSDFSSAIDLSRLPYSISSYPLTIHANDEDCFKFTIPANIAATEDNYITIQFQQAQGDLQLELYKAGTSTPLTASTKTANSQTISLKNPNISAGDYLIRVLGKDANTANSYQLFTNLPQQAAASPQKQQNDWTFLVYMTGSDLNQYAKESINAMELAVSQLPNSVNIAVLWDQSPSTGNKTTYATGASNPWSGTGVCIIRPDSDITTITSSFQGFDGSSVVPSLDLNFDANTGDPKTIENFIKWSKNAAPANNYGLILWDHGSGDLDGFNVDNEGNTSQKNADRLYTNELITAISNSAIGSELKLIAFDACLMAMTEVAYSLRNYADVFVASQEVEPSGGWDYATAFSSLLFNPSQVSAQDVAASIVNSYQAKFQGDFRGWDTLSAIDLQKLRQPDLVQKLEEFTDQAISFIQANANNASIINVARDAATAFFGTDHLRDLGQFLDAVGNQSGSSPALKDLKDAAIAASIALNNLVVAQTADKRDTSGLSVFLPNTPSTLSRNIEVAANANNSSYNTRNSDFLTQTGWTNFLNTFVGQAVSTSISPDWAENNDIAARSFDLHTLVGSGNQFSGLSLHKAADNDWYRFAIKEQGALSVSVSNGLSFKLYQLSKDGDGNTSRVEVNSGISESAPKGDYLVNVVASNITVPSYSLTINAPGTPSNDHDWTKGNDTPQKAKELGTISARTIFSGLQIDATTKDDWFTFELPKLNSDRIAPVQVAVNLIGSQAATAQLFVANPEPSGSPIAITTSQSGTGTLSLLAPDPTPGKIYQLKISGSSPVAYSLGFEPTSQQFETNGQPNITLALSAATLTEDGTTNLIYTFSRTGSTTSALAVNYTVGGTATVGTDYTGIAATPATKTVTFAANSSTATVTVDPTADTSIESDETVVLTLAAGSGYIIGTTAAVTGTITNDDFPVITLAVAPAAVAEDGTTNLIYTFTRTGPTTSALTVNYGITGTADATDYTGAIPGAGKTITFAVGSAIASLTIDPTADTTIEADETVALTLATGTGYTIGTTAAVVGTISNDDFPVITLAVSPTAVTEDGTTNLVYTFTRTGPATSALSVKYKVGGTATLGTDYTGIAANPATKTVSFAAGSATAILTIDPTADITIEADETVALTLAAGKGYSIGTTAAVVGTVTNDDFPVITLDVSSAAVSEDGTTNLVYTFTRTGATTSALTVNYGISGTSDSADYIGATPGAGKAITFAAGAATATLTIDPTADTTIEANETVALTLAAGTGYTIGTTAAVTGTITNDDFPVITLDVSPVAVAEDGPTNLVFTFTRTGSTTSALNLLVNIGGTAFLNGPFFLTGGDYALSGNVSGAAGTTATITFPAGSATATVTADPIADTAVEADETVVLTLPPGTTYIVGNPNPSPVGNTFASATGTITNDDTLALPVITLAVSPASVPEDGTTNLIYTFTRTGPATSALSVKYKVGGTATLGTDYTGIASTPATKTVNFADGSATATLTINPTADTTIEANETVSLTLAAGTGYTIGTTAAVTGTITNDDLPVITLAVAPATVTEDSTTNLVYTFSRTGPTSSALSVKYTVGGTATLGTDYTGIASTPATKTVSFAAGSATATVTVDPKADTTIEANETVALTLAAGKGYSIGTTAAVVGTITNDDVSSSTTYTLLPTQSSLQLLGGMRINGIGNDLNNTITGNNKNNKLHGLLGADTLIGGGTADSDVFAYNSLGESLLGTGSSFDLITDFNNRDFILAPLTVETERLSSAIGSVNSLTSASIEGLLTASSFAANSVAAFTVAGQVGTYIAMNDGRGGFQADSDAIVFLPNYAISNVNFVEFI